MPNQAMTPRNAYVDDVHQLARMHVRAWEETYRGLLPDAAFVEKDLTYRLDLYERIIGSGAKISIIPHVGFAQVGPQRDPVLAYDYPVELISFYVLKKFHGKGAAQMLLQHAMVPFAKPFTAHVLQTNARAIGFYEKIGGRRIGLDHFHIDGQEHADIVMGFDALTVPTL